MQLYETEGIIFRTVKYSETSIICDIFTREKGLRSYIISGVRSSRKGNNAAIYQPANIVRLISYDTGSEKLARIKEIHLAYHYQSIIVDVVMSTLLIFCIELSRNAIKEREENEELYQFLIDKLKEIDSGILPRKAAPVIFMLELSKTLGFEPLNNFDTFEMPIFDLLEGSFADRNTSGHTLSIDDSYTLHRTISDINHYTTLEKVHRSRLIDHLLVYYKLHLPGFRDIKSIDIIRQVL